MAELLRTDLSLPIGSAMMRTCRQISFARLNDV
jgi:hypothetical protein